jgi:hypothetical protein
MTVAYAPCRHFENLGSAIANHDKTMRRRARRWLLGRICGDGRA